MAALVAHIELDINSSSALPLNLTGSDAEIVKIVEIFLAVPAASGLDFEETYAIRSCDDRAQHPMELL